MLVENIEKKVLNPAVRAKMPVLGIDLGGTKLSAAIVLDGCLVGEPVRVATPEGAERIIDTICRLLEELRQSRLIAGLGIATAGIVNVESGQVVGSTGNIPGWEGTPLKTILERRVFLPVHVENDANAAAYGEYVCGDLSDKRCLVLLTLGTGIGAGVVIDGKLYRGAHWAAGECGHLKVNMGNRRLCTCGLFDCWEAYGSGRGLVATGCELAAGLKEEQSELVAKGKNLTTQDIIDAFARGDELARRALHQWHEHICLGMVSIAHTLDPDCFVLSGGMEKFVDYTLLKELLADRCLPRIAEKLEIRPSVLGGAGGMVGAAQLVLDCLQTR